jgi:HSP20 family protein
MARNMTRSNQTRDMTRSGSFPNIGDLFREFSLVPSLRGLEPEPRMKVDVEETDQAYILKAEVPGADREDITVSIDGNVVSIRADVEEERVDENGNMIRSERMFGEELRSFTLPQEVDESKAQAKMENGVLVLTLPKKSGGSSKKLAIQ